jgi:hypothetical protein
MSVGVMEDYKLMPFLNQFSNSETNPHFDYKSPFTDVRFLTMYSNFGQ